MIAKVWMCLLIRCFLMFSCLYLDWNLIFHDYKIKLNINFYQIFLHYSMVFISELCSASMYSYRIQKNLLQLRKKLKRNNMLVFWIILKIFVFIMYFSYVCWILYILFRDSTCYYYFLALTLSVLHLNYVHYFNIDLSREWKMNFFFIRTTHEVALMIQVLRMEIRSSRWRPHCFETSHRRRTSNIS